MIVMKFGGTSVGTPERIDNVFQIVNRHLGQKPVVVVSAVGGVTDLLLAAGDKAKGGTVDIEAIKIKHQNVIEGLGLEKNMIDDIHEELTELLIGIKMIKEISPKTSDYLVSFGERVSCQLVSAYFRQKGLASQHHFAYDIGMDTDDVHQGAQPTAVAFDQIAKHISSIDYVPVITGFIGKNAQGDITTLGRGGSDYSAAIIGAAIEAEEIQIWTDVDGILTTDPRIVSVAKNLPEVSFKEAAELAYFGAKVLHPKTIRPAMEKQIPVVVKNTGNMEHPGTRIVNNPKDDGKIKAISVKKDISLINIYSLRMLDAYGFLAKIFEIFARHKVIVDMVSTSEVSVSVTVDKGAETADMVSELSQIAQVKVEEGYAIICLVGQGIRDTVGIAATAFRAVAEEDIPIDVISQGSSDINLGFVIKEERAPHAVKALHKLFFEGE